MDFLARTVEKGWPIARGQPLFSRLTLRIVIRSITTARARLLSTQPLDLTGVWLGRLVGATLVSEAPAGFQLR